MKNILAENMLRFGTKNLSESNKKILQEADNDPGDPSQSTITITNTYNALRQALNTYNAEYKKIVGQDIGLFFSAGANSDSIGIYSNLQGDQNKALIQYDTKTGGIIRRRRQKDPSGSGGFYWKTKTFSDNDINGAAADGEYGLAIHGVTDAQKQLPKLKPAAIAVMTAVSNMFKEITPKLSAGLKSGKTMKVNPEASELTIQLV